MGCGKTTLGRAVASAASMQFIDLDELIERESGMTIREIFNAHGEPYFRQLERETLEQVSKLDDVIIATGGGTPCQTKLMDLMLATGTPVFLEASIECLHSRLLQGRSARPLIASLSDDELLTFIANALDQRKPHYTRAAARFDSSRLEDAKQIAESTQRFIKQFIVQ